MNLIALGKQPLDSRQLKAFVIVARTLSFTEAGRELFLTQSAVSHAVKGLEDEVGQRLLNRDGKKLQITPAGEHLLHYAQKILADMALARDSLEQRSRWGANRLRVGADGFFGPCLLTNVLRMFRRDFPHWPVSVKAGDSQECVEWLSENTIDVAIAIAPNRAEPVEVVPLFADELMWIVPPGHPWARNGIAVTSEIPSQTLVCCNTASYTCRLLEKYFDRENVRLNWEMELASLEAIKEMVKEGTGITVLAPWAVRKELDEKTLISLPLGKRKLKRNWGLLRALDHKPSLAEETFATLCMKAANNLSSLASAVAVMTCMLWPVGLESDLLAVAV